MSKRQKAYEQAKSSYGKDTLLPVTGWARRYGDMLDGADEAPTLNDLCEAIENIRKRSRQAEADAYARGFDEGFASADDWIAQNEDAMRDHGWVKDSRDRRDLLDEIAWLNSELHGAEMEAKKLRELVRDIWNQARLCDANAHIEGMRLTERAREEYMSRMEELGVEVEQ